MVLSSILAIWSSLSFNMNYIHNGVQYNVPLDKTDYFQLGGYSNNVNDNNSTEYIKTINGVSFPTPYDINPEHATGVYSYSFTSNIDNLNYNVLTLTFYDDTIMPLVSKPCILLNSNMYQSNIYFDITYFSENDYFDRVEVYDCLSSKTTIYKWLYSSDHDTSYAYLGLDKLEFHIIPSNIYENMNSNNNYDAGFDDGYDAGKIVGYQEAVESIGTAETITASVLQIGVLPVEVFLKMFDYEVFGINIASIITSLIMVAVIIIITRVILGGGVKND